MWKLIKAEIVLNKVSLLIAYCLVISFFIMLIMSKAEINILGIILAIFISGAIATGITSPKYKDKRDRFHITLPLSIKKIGIARLAYPVLVYFSLAILFFITSFMLKAYSIKLNTLWEILSINGFALILITCTHIHHDLKFYFLNKNQRAAELAIYMLVMLVMAFEWFKLILQRGQLGTFEEHILFSPIGAFGCNLIGIGLAYLSILVFTKRKSYSEQ